MAEERSRVIECEVFSRVVGYYRPVQCWNKGKKQEFSDRNHYSQQILLKGTQK